MGSLATRPSLTPFIDRPWPYGLTTLFAAASSLSGPAFVLTMGGYYGTLSAVRCLGNRGVPLIMADAGRFTPALWSRHVTS